MEKEERLGLLFAQDEALLKIDTGRRPVSDSPDRPTAPETDYSKHTGEETKPSVPTSQEAAQIIQEPPLEGHHSSPGLPSSLQEEKPNLETLPIRPSNGQFSPLLAIARYPYKNIKGDLSKQVSNRFFDAGKFWNRPWDIYYIHAPPSLGSKCVLLTPTSEVNNFFQEINREMKCGLSLSTDVSAGFILTFKDEYPQPIYAGHSTSRETKDRLEGRISAPTEHSYSAEGDMNEEYAAFETMMEHAIDAIRNKKKSSKQKQMMRAMHEYNTQNMIRRMQRYFGLHPVEDADEEAEMLIWDSPGAVPTVQTLDVTKAAPHPFWREPVFISIDIESNERCHAQITEVGVSTLDMLSLVGIPPDEKGKEWRSRIQSRHLRVKEYGHIVNHDFVAGCPAMFQFGESEWVLQRDLGDVVRSFLRLGDAMSRRLVLVGHSLSQDVKYLKQIGVDVEGFRDRVDTAEVFRMLRGETSVRSLGGVLAELDMMGWYLHNAGNDARYTMEVLVASLLGVKKE
ncbi:QDE-2-interacting protein [Aspergillus ibericus CBS 121593]|uniref:QDE-2-interacting protein n=1 Tax=Aspergillus ibericus CBS 121593 TaxID=1448316 RepID=A0A395H1J1_9EURO|nr:QDE-2-interacting protein [Aspergillus ibericus CBS 121593]RAL01736.1 QDE-2-interacting protein [Aspergillus ibericus CBS 121593]